MKLSSSKLFAAFVFAAIFYVRQASCQSEYMIGADLSFMKQAEETGFTFKENGKAVPGLELFKRHGYNRIRLRLFHTPDKLPNNLEYTIALAKQAKDMGYKFLLDYHYSDTWADPGKQFIPEAWKKMTQKEMVEAVFDYTLETMNEFRKAGAYPDMVQIGNEVSNGMLWPNGKLPDNWDGFIELLKAGINGVHASCTSDTKPADIMIHIDKGGDWNFTKDYFDKLHSYGVKYDIIGQSYYPWWHGTLLDLQDCLHKTIKAYGKNVVVVEAAYNKEPKEYLGKDAPFEESPEGQKEFLEAVHNIVMNAPDNKGAGVFYWEPANNWDRTFFDKDGNALPVITVFDKYTRK